MINILPILILKDNYVWVMAPNNGSKCVIFDPGESAPVVRFLRDSNLVLGAIVVTHRHWDHTDGIEDLKCHYNCPVYGPESDAIPQITVPVYGGDSFSPLKGVQLDVISIPGHTSEHIGYLFKSEGIANLFCGDTLFSAGCGRLLGGTAQQLKTSIDRIKRLPANTRIYCTHEYTLTNLDFAQMLMPNNSAIAEHRLCVNKLRANHEASLPTSVEQERAINPFLRCQDNEIITAVTEHFSTQPSNEQEVFTLLRKWKDVY